MILAFDDPMLIAKGFFFSESLLLVAFIDGLTHEIPNGLLVPVLAAGLIDFQLMESMEGFFAVSLVFLLVSVLTHGGIGGGDVKLMAAAGFVLGPFGTVGGALIGLSLIYIFHLLFRRNRCERKRYAMAPWLSAGCILSYLLTGGIAS